MALEYHFFCSRNVLYSLNNCTNFAYFINVMRICCFSQSEKLFIKFIKFFIKSSKNSHSALISNIFKLGEMTFCFRPCQQVFTTHKCSIVPSFFYIQDQLEWHDRFLDQWKSICSSSLHQINLRFHNHI